MTLVSIITPSRNQASYLEQTILSVLSQDYRPIEYIIIDGASTDGSVAIIKKYSSHISFWISEKDSGQADAINKGIFRSNGDIVAWLNSDDCYLPGVISKVVKTFEENPDVVLLYGDVYAIDEHGSILNALNYKQLTLDDLLCFQIIGQPAVFMRRSALFKVNGLDTSYHFLLDHYLWIQFALYGKILHVPQKWAMARYHSKAKNRAKATEFGREAFRILEYVEKDENIRSVFSKIKRRARAAAYRIDARYLLDGGQPSAAIAAWLNAFLYNPLTALSRMNILVSSILEILGLGKLRKAFMAIRAKWYQG